jgi:hypothetical protein
MNEWISVNDKLPEVYKLPETCDNKSYTGDVLACVVYTNLSNGTHYKELCLSHLWNGAWIDEEGVPFREPYAKVTHWMPLPNFPDEQEG